MEDRLRHAYNNMIRRCYNPNAKDYRFYGAKGISVCDEWKKDKQSFYRWAYKTGYNNTMTIDRIDSKKNYCPENCRWVDAKTNAKIKSTTRMITIDGITDSLSGWGVRFNIPRTTLTNRAKTKTDEEMTAFILSHKKEKEHATV